MNSSNFHTGELQRRRDLSSGDHCDPPITWSILNGRSVNPSETDMTMPATEKARRGLL